MSAGEPDAQDAAQSVMDLLREQPAAGNRGPTWLLVVAEPGQALQARLQRDVQDSLAPTMRWYALGGDSSWPSLLPASPTHAGPSWSALPQLDPDTPIRAGDVLVIRPDAYLALHWPWPQRDQTGQPDLSPTSALQAGLQQLNTLIRQLRAGC